MALLNELFSTTEGLFSFGVILFVMIIGGYIFQMVKKKINEEPQIKK